MPRRHDRARPRPVDVELALDRPDEGALQQRGDPDAAQHLENLRVALGEVRPDLFARLDRPHGRPPRLRVTSPTTPGVTENISHRAGAAACDAGHFVWDWGQVVGNVTDLDQSTASVLRVLDLARGRTP